MIKVDTKFDRHTNTVQFILSKECEENLNKFEMFLGIDELEELLSQMEDAFSLYPPKEPEFHKVTNFDIDCQCTKDQILDMIEYGEIYPSDGDGVWGTKDTLSDISMFAPCPDWATHAYWYNK